MFSAWSQCVSISILPTCTRISYWSRSHLWTVLHVLATAQYVFNGEISDHDWSRYIPLWKFDAF